MVRIVNGVIVTDNDPSSSAPTSFGGGNFSGGVVICGFNLSYWMLGGIVLVSSLLGGVKGNYVLVLVYIFDKKESQYSVKVLSSSKFLSFSSSFQVQSSQAEALFFCT